MKDLILNFLSGTITKKEKETLRNWLKKPKNKATFNAYVRDVYATNLAYNNVDTTKAYKQTISAIEKQTKVIPLYKRSFVKYAAAILIFASISYTYLFEKDEFNSVAYDNIEIGKDKATLTLNDGTEVNLEKGTQYVSDNMVSDGENLIYTPTVDKGSEISYNYLTVPRGGQFFIELVDGTKVWMNSESKLKYPTQFVNNKTREVELLYGEAYFDVSESTNHNGTAFKVKTNTQYIKVLGTEFNIKSYKDDNTYTTLVEGKVEVSNGEQSKVLKPGEQAITKQRDKVIDLSKVDVSKAIAWKNNLFVFENETLEGIMITLSRWYNVTVVYKDQEKKKMLFSGQLPKTHTIQSILSKFEKTGADDVTFEINDKTIIIK